ncbi:hypothetical protein BDV96DRAFT_606141 [Lophiotrema nucula]|uniref:Heterokaryon incompatibility domain-containing protein n=1 Tax=Lophiotrema nucula TaxID=690887 RepID=A0A6A5YKU3_9PLEO|nr:hypothetical protein BDV96DRAFT_606141 [Lophiotrema nucula]
MDIITQMADVRLQIYPEKTLGSWAVSSIRQWRFEIAWEPVIAIWSRNYWKRMWIIQELALNLNMTLFMCGSQGPEGQSLRLIGIPPSSNSTQISPDHDKTKEEVYQEFAYILLKQCERLDEVLSWCSLVEGSALPSWVPDWSTPFNRYQLHWLRIRKAGGDMRAAWSVSDSGKELWITGIIIDDVKVVGLPLSQSIPYRTFRRDPLAMHRTLLQDHENAHQNSSLLDIYWVDWDQLKEPDPWDFGMDHFWTFGMPKITKTENATRDSWQIFDRFRQSNTHFPVFGQCLKDLFPNMRKYRVEAISKYKYPGAPVDEWRHHPHELTEKHSANIHISRLALDGRKLITTETGFLGLAPEETRRGDVIAVYMTVIFPLCCVDLGRPSNTLENATSMA